ncbi:uncharacterized protein LOC121529996 [Drosophila eugracilis]|uniref:uncharacterized protein LOC121529996 n=1 Tax=Drosophila eugracilis TaxID=29029 RepID=UPI001BD9FA86|nr:uncharacterized protein LOC121529996 [Drosophila eugracilis]
MSSRLFCKSSDNKSRSYIAELSRTNRHSDCSFLIEGENGNTKTFPCHKLIFSSASDVFDRMLFGDYFESSSGIVRISDVEPEIFEKFREYIYDCDYEKLQKYDFDTLVRLCELGNKYLVDHIQDDIIRVFMDRKYSFDMGQLLRLYQLGHQITRDSLIKKIGWKIQCCTLDKLEHPFILKLNFHIFRNYLFLITGKINEVQRFKLLEKYLKHNNIEVTEVQEPMVKVNNESSNNVENAEADMDSARSSTVSEEVKDDMPNDLRRLINQFEFFKSTPDEYHEGPGKSNLLTMAQKYEHMYEIAQYAEEAKKELIKKLHMQPAQPSQPQRVFTVGEPLARDEPTSSTTSQQSPRVQLLFTSL